MTEDKWKIRERTTKRALLVADIARIEARAYDLGMYKTGMRVRDNLIPLACEDFGDAVASETATEVQQAQREAQLAQRTEATSGDAE